MGKVFCAVGKCYAAFDACLAFGSGSNSCVKTAACAGACTYGDLGCAVSCLSGAGKGVTAKAKGLLSCAHGACSDKFSDSVALPGCVSQSCAAEVDACHGGKPMNCLTFSACLAKCPEFKKSSPNSCAGVCGAFSAADSLEVRKKYETCKEQCTLVTNKVGCVIAKCGAEQTACYTDAGPKNCQEVYDCVVKDCQGIGGDPACIFKCVKQGKPEAQDAFLEYEGCVLLNLDRDEAKTYKCKFPYDLATCINQIAGQFCGHKSSSCFTSN